MSLESLTADLTLNHSYHISHITKILSFKQRITPGETISSFRFLCSTNVYWSTGQIQQSV